MKYTLTVLLLTLAIVAADEPVICPKCKEAGEKSTVQYQGSFSTCISVSAGFDENGYPKAYRDPNITTSYFTCSKGHSFQRTNK